MSKKEDGKWYYKINYGPNGEENYANVYDKRGDFVGNLKLKHAIAIVNAMNAHLNTLKGNENNYMYWREGDQFTVDDPFDLITTAWSYEPGVILEINCIGVFDTRYYAYFPEENGYPEVRIDEPTLEAATTRVREQLRRRVRTHIDNWKQTTNMNDAERDRQG